jgi:hypothetical protein
MIMPERHPNGGHLVRMSFVFPPMFYNMLTTMSGKYNKNMTYIVMEAVNEWVMQKEGIDEEDLS